MTKCAYMLNIYNVPVTMLQRLKMRYKMQTKYFNNFNPGNLLCSQKKYIFGMIEKVFP